MYGIEYLDYKNKIGNLNVEASSNVKSKKYFPIYLINEKEYIFKPLSKTKPFTTPLYSYAEVFWSNIINKYFEDAPVYKLAFCRGYEKAEQKYYDRGTLVENILSKDQKLINVYEYFRDNPDENVNITDYINYCMMFYDYTNIFKTDLIKRNPAIGNELAYQILLSVLKADQNYHYENVAFISDGLNLKLAPMLDHEFSTMFLFPDDVRLHVYFFDKFIQSLENEIIYNNVIYIKEHYPDVVTKFAEHVKVFQKDIDSLLLEKTEFICDWNSNYWEIGQALYKDNDVKKAKRLEKKMFGYPIDLDSMTKLCQAEIQITINKLFKILEVE